MLSIVIPVFNESESLATLHRELSEVAAARNYDLDVVFVDDGSTDGSAELVQQVGGGRVRLIRQANGGVAKARRPCLAYLLAARSVARPAAAKRLSRE